MTPFVVDDQRQPRSEPLPIFNLRMPFEGVVAHEIPLRVWQEVNGWIETEPGGLA